MMKDKKEKYMEEKTKSSETAVEAEVSEEVTSELFEEVKTTEATLVNASDVEDELATTRANVAQWLEKNVLNK